MSDIIFLRAWIGVDLPKFYNPVTNLLAPAVRMAPRELKPGHMVAEVSGAVIVYCDYGHVCNFCGCLVSLCLDSTILLALLRVCLPLSVPSTECVISVPTCGHRHAQTLHKA